MSATIQRPKRPCHSRTFLSGIYVLDPRLKISGMTLSTRLLRLYLVCCLVRQTARRGPSTPPHGRRIRPLAEKRRSDGPRRALWRAMMFFFIFLIAGSSFAEEIPIRIDGRVIRTDEAKRLLVIHFENPATGEKAEKEFVVNEGAGFKDFNRLSDLKEGDLVSLDYLDYKTMLKAIYVIKIPATKTYFTHQEIAGALLKIKANQKDSNV